jgi:protoheme IX farnesyltransferase
MINYYLLTKPGIILGNLITVAAGFILASHKELDLLLFLATLFGLACVIASACVFNNYIDRAIDKKMERTKNRPLAKGVVSARNAILFAICLGIAGFWILFFYTNPLTALIAGTGFVVYVVLYSLWKCRTLYGTAIGSIAGGVPPVVGYCAVSNQFDLGALILFTMMVCWQMPHFFSIAVYRFDDYKAASLPVLPVKKGMLITKQRMVLYIIAFMLACITLTVFHYTGYLYLITAAFLSLTWLSLTLMGFKTKNDRLWGRQMFRLSLLIITTLCILIPFDLAS